MDSCAAHPDQPSVTVCPDCLRPICERCLDYADGRDLCPTCAGRHRERRTASRVAFLVLGLAVLAMGAWLGVVRPRLLALLGGGAPIPVEARAAEDRAPQIAALRQRLARTPCDAGAAIELGDALILAGASDEVTPMADAFAARCGRSAQLLWKVYEASKRTGEWQRALAVATDLIEHDPADKDYWWWRGIVYEQLGRLDEALADYRQTLAVRPDIDRIPFNLADLYERMKRPCDAALALQQFVHWHPDALEDAGLRMRLDRLQRDGRCQALVHGAALIRFPPGSRLIPVEAVVHGTRGRFLVDTGASVVAVTRDFARRAGLPDGGAALRVATAGGIVPARVVQLEAMSVQGAAATGVEAAVIDALPGGFDGLVGLSFLSRLELKLDAAAGTLELAARRP